MASSTWHFLLVFSTVRHWKRYPSYCHYTKLNSMTPITNSSNCSTNSVLQPFLTQKFLIQSRTDTIQVNVWKKTPIPNHTTLRKRQFCVIQITNVVIQSNWMQVRAESTEYWVLRLDQKAVFVIAKSTKTHFSTILGGKNGKLFLDKTSQTCNGMDVLV